MQIVAAGQKFLWTVQLQEKASGQTQAWIKVLESVDGPIRKSLETLEAEFRALMGDTE